MRHGIGRGTVARPEITLLAVAAMLSGTAGTGRAWETSLKIDVNSAHVWRGVTRNADPVVQPSVTWSDESGLHLGFWGCLDLNDYRDADGGDFSEIDAAAWYAVRRGPLRMKAGIIKYTYHHQPGPAETREVFLGLAAETGAATLTAETYYDFDEFDEYYLRVGLNRGLELRDFVDLDLAVLAGCAGEAMAPGGRSGWHDWQLSAGLNYAPPGPYVFGAQLVYTAPADTSVLPRQDVDWYGGARLEYHF